LSIPIVENFELCQHAQTKGCVFVFYDNFIQLCKKHGVSPSKAAVDAGLSKSTVTKWKTTPDAQPTGTAIKKLSDYFCVPISELLNEEEQKNPPSELALTERESRILEALRSKTPAERKAFLTLLGISED
jgi:transcriptional regulator with XRE-family HTH domain